MTNPTLWNQVLIWPILNLLIAFYKLFEAIKFPGPLGFAVIAMTIVIRLVLYPLMKSQMTSAKKMSDLKPKLDDLSKVHKDNKQALQQAQLNLYKEHGVNPAAGCLPLLIQMPVLIALYNVFYQVLNNGNTGTLVEQINSVLYSPALKLSTLDLTFFGINLGIKPSAWQNSGWWLLSIPVITGLLQYWQSKLMMPQQKSAVDSGQPTETIKNVKKPSKQDLKSVAVNEAVKSDDKKPDVDQAAEMQKQMALISPIMFAMFAYQFPLGLALYWNVFGLFGIMQQMSVNKNVQIAGVKK